MTGTTDTSAPRKHRDRIGIVLYLIYLVLLVAGLLIVLRIAQIQIFFRPDPKIESALTPKTTARTIIPKRGNIYDCHGRLSMVCR